MIHFSSNFVEAYKKEDVLRYSFLWDVVWDYIPEEQLPRLQVHKSKNMEGKRSL